MSVTQRLSDALVQLSKVRVNDKASNTALAKAKTLIREAREEVTPIPEPTPDPEPIGLIVGLDAGSYGTDGANDVAGCVNHVRVSIERGPTTLKNYTNLGLTTNLNFSGPYSNSGVQSLNVESWVKDALDYYSANTDPSKTPIIEVLNEPAGSWFWGSGADSQANADAYRRLVEATYNAFHAKYGSAVKVIADVQRNGVDWGKKWWKPGICDGVIVHPYGGIGSRTSSAEGNRALVQAARDLTNSDIYCTEIGWPSGAGKVPATSDSLQWSETEQAENIKNFIDWAKTKPWIKQVIYFNYRDFGGSNLYGVVRGDGSHKPSYTTLRSLA